MNRRGATYNERSWAIDLIGHLKHIARGRERPIKDAGGERTIHADGGALFPDVLLFGDRSTARILQGWELKMPDTNIDDADFFWNAETKARALGLDSFLLWNVSVARLFVRDQDTDTYVLENTWSDLADIAHRKSVAPNRERWEQMAGDIVGYLNDLFDRGELEGRQFIDSYRTGGITALIMENKDLVENALKDAARRDSKLRAEMTLWWDRYQTEYIGNQMELVLAQAVIANWIAKILFAHILREIDSRARKISEIQDQTTPDEALDLFQKLSRDCDFWTIFSDSLGLSALPDRSWYELKQFNRLLTDLRLGSVDQQQLSGILEATVEVARRKLRGQYPTPMPLAKMLTNLCLRDIVSDRLLDPCCGSGTIARAALEQKLAADVPPKKAAAAVFAGDQDPQAVQIATFALANPRLMNVPLRIFQQDAFSLGPRTKLAFRNPTDGTPFAERMGQFDAIASNLPFVAQTGRSQYGNAISEVTEILREDGQEFSRRADIAAYLPFAFHSLLVDQGRLGIIITNAWLGTDWGDAFYDALNRFYDLKCVIASGAGRWFQSSDVVTNILIMEKKNERNSTSGEIKFILLKRPLEEFEDDEDQKIAVSQIELGRAHSESMSIRTVSRRRLARFRSLGLGGTAQFVNCDWILKFPLVSMNSHFHVRRGERRGMNALYYPNLGHGIETEYIRPLSKSSADFSRLIGEANKEAFSCSRSLDELRQLGHTGALNWIRRFSTSETIEKLSRPGLYWYEMSTDNLTELVMSINYGERLFVGRLDPPAFVDQRLVRLVPKKPVDISLYHALLNSSVGLFIIEGLGFGRGLGALDLNKDRVERYMQMIDPDVFDHAERVEIIEAFLPLLEREILNVADELDEPDRQNFDEQVFRALSLDVEREEIYDCLRSLVEIRSTARN